MHARASPTLAKPQAENSSLSIKWPKFVGNGTYGNVWKIDDKNIKKITKIFTGDGNDIVWSTLKEICFHTAFSHSNIRSLTRIELHEGKDRIDLIMPDAGKTLSDWVKLTSADVRLHIIPYIVIQILYVLLFLEKHGISHGDLKPWNIMINENFHVFIIDWGAVCLNPLFHIKNSCTAEFSAPELLESVAKNSCSADIFSLGLIIRYLVYGQDETPDWISTQCSTKGFAPIMRSTEMTRHKKSIDLIKCFQPLLSADPTKRPKASEIIEWKELRVYRYHFRQSDHHSNVTYNNIPIQAKDWSNFNHLNFQVRKNTITWFYEIINQQFPIRFLPFAIELMDQYVIRKKLYTLSEKHLRFILLACFCISNSLFSNSIDHTSLISSKNNSLVYKQFKETIIGILNGLDWNIYIPMWDREIFEPNGEAMLKVLTCEEIFDSTQSEKLAFYEKLQTDNSKSKCSPIESIRKLVPDISSCEKV